MNKVVFDYENDNQLPQVPTVIYEVLNQQFDLGYILTRTDLKNNDERVGYMRGVRDVLERIAILCNIREE